MKAGAKIQELDLGGAGSRLALCEPLGAGRRILRVDACRERKSKRGGLLEKSGKYGLTPGAGMQTALFGLPFVGELSPRQ